MNLHFESASELEEWFEANAAQADELWIQIAKKGSGIASASYGEALELALCFGWIDSRKRGLDDEFFLQRFTPRRPRGSPGARTRFA